MKVVFQGGGLRRVAADWRLWTDALITMTGPLTQRHSGSCCDCKSQQIGRGQTRALDTSASPHLSLHRQGDADADVGLAVHEVGGPVQRVHQPRRRVRQRVRGALRRRPLLPCAPVAVSSCPGLCCTADTLVDDSPTVTAKQPPVGIHCKTWPGDAHTPGATSSRSTLCIMTISCSPINL